MANMRTLFQKVRTERSIANRFRVIACSSPLTSTDGPGYLKCVFTSTPRCLAGAMPEDDPWPPGLAPRLCADRLSWTRIRHEEFRNFSTTFRSVLYGDDRNLSSTRTVRGSLCQVRVGLRSGRPMPPPSLETIAKRMAPSETRSAW